MVMIEMVSDAGRWGFGPGGVFASPSNILTAVGKSLTLLAALRAATMTMGDGTRS
jgi:hypothetical protein